MLEPWGLTYPQYLVLVTLWIEGDQTVSSLGDHLQLDSGTLSPLLRRMEQADLVRRERRSTDERVVTVTLGDRGRTIRPELAHVPARIAQGMGLPDEQAALELIGTLQRLTATMHAAAEPGPTSPPARRSSSTDPHEGRNHMEALYTAEALSTGAGRDGRVATSDGSFALDLAIPKEMGGSATGRTRSSCSPPVRRLLPLRTPGCRACAEGEDHGLVRRRPRADRPERRRWLPLAVLLEVVLPDSSTTRPRPSRTPRTRCARTRTPPAATSTSPSPSRRTDHDRHHPHRHARRRPPQFGEPADVLTAEERPVPTPGAGEVLVRTVLSPIHNHDLWTIRGTYGFKPELPAASGTEALGVVEALGEASRTCRSASASPVAPSASGPSTTSRTPRVSCRCRTR